jgi:recombination protein RecA
MMAHSTKAIGQGNKKAKVRLTPEQELALIQKTLEHPSKDELGYWLDTGNRLFNSVIGSPDKGAPYGKIIEISGFESHGKTALSYWLAGIGQKDGAEVAIWDLESSWDPEWARKRGLDPARVIVFKSILGYFGGEKKKRLITAEEQVSEIEMWMQMKEKANPDGRLVIVVDSIAALDPKDSLDAGMEDQNMRTKVSVAAFLSILLKRWQKLAVNYNALIILVNQVRVAPGVRFGNPEYTPGGNAIRFYASVRLKVRRRGGKILKNGKDIGFKAVITNWKNKAGEGSTEHLKCGFKLLYDGRSKFVPESEIKPDKADS